MAEKRPRLSTGNIFMPDTIIEELRDIYKNTRTILKLLACIKRKEVNTLSDIGRAINCWFKTVSAWLWCIHRLGLEGRYHDTHPGAACKLAPEQLHRRYHAKVPGRRGW